MKTLILFTTNNGTTQKYAEDVGSAVGADVMPLKKFKWKNIDDYDIVAYFGWVMGGRIKGIDNFLQHWDSDLSEKQVIVVANGMGLPTAETRANLISTNLLDMYHLRFYQFQGSFDMQKLKFPYKSLMQMTLKKIEADPETTAMEKTILTIRDTPIEVYDHQKVERVIQVIRTIEQGSAA